MAAWTFQGAAKRLEDVDLPRIAATIGVGEDELHAFMEVESRGSGFDAQGRPKILFEMHIFYRCLPKAKRSAAVQAGLAAQKWGAIPYGKESAQYDRLLRAVEIDQTAALKACSWGLTQILGENHAVVGYDTVQDMVLAFMEDEENHVTAMVQFLVANELDDDLKAHRWAAVARGYNGAGYRKNAYDTKMAAAYKKWARIPDTHWEPADATPVQLEPGPEPDKAAAEPYVAPKSRPVPDGKWGEQTLERYEVEAIQKRFREMGYFIVGKVDGEWGPSTRAAVTALQAQAHDGTSIKAADSSVVIDGHWGPQTKRLLSDETNRRYISEARSNTTVDDLRQQGSSQIKEADRVEDASKAVGGIGAGGLLASVMEYFGQLRQFAANLPPWVWALFLTVVAVGLILLAWHLKRRADGIKLQRLNAERSGLHNGEPDPAPSPPVTAAPEVKQGIHNVSSIFARAA